MSSLSREIAEADNESRLTSGPLARIGELWELRNTGQVAEAWEGYLALAADCGLRAADSVAIRFHRLVELGCTTGEARDFLLLGSSFLRMEKRVAESRAEIRSLEALLRESNSPHGFQLPFQQGLNALVESDYSTALESFAEAKRAATTPLERAGAVYNQIQALEGFGLDTSHLLPDLENSVRNLREHGAERMARFSQAKWESLTVESWYGAGNLDRILAAEPTLEAEPHLLYFLSWLAHLPYLSAPGCAAEERFSKECAHGTDRWLADFRLRTLRGLLIEADRSSSIRVREKIERFYLWTWRWVAIPQISTLEKLALLRADLKRDFQQPLTAEVFQLFENASRWLALFAGLSPDESRQTFLGINAIQGKTIPTLDFESGFLDYLFARRCGQEALCADAFEFLRQHPAANQASFLLPQLLRTLHEGTAAPPSLRGLAAELGELFPKPEPKIMTGIVVNGLERSVRIVEQGKIKHEWKMTPLALLLRQFRDKESVAKGEVLRACFSIPRYDPYVHDPKIANFLCAANRRLRPMLRFQVKAERVFVSRLTDCPLLLECFCEHSGQLGSFTAELFQGRHQVVSGAQEWANGLQEFTAEWRTRSDFERLLGVSKATATRKIQFWLKKKWMTKQGRGKSCRYRMQPELVEHLQKKRKAL